MYTFFPPTPISDRDSVVRTSSAKEADGQIRQHVTLCDIGIELQSGFCSCFPVQWLMYAGRRRWMPSATPCFDEAAILVPYQRRTARPPSGNWVMLLQSLTGCAQGHKARLLITKCQTVGRSINKAYLVRVPSTAFSLELFYPNETI